MKDNRAMSNSDEFEPTFEDLLNDAIPIVTSSSPEKHPNLTLLESGQNPGELLKSAREKLGLSLASVSLQTKINERQLQVIESGIAERLPPETFAKAFIKSYCKVVNLDSGPVLEAFGFDVGTGVGASVRPSSPDAHIGGEPKMPSSSRRLSSLSFDRKPVKKKLGYIVALAALGTMAVFYVPVFFDGLNSGMFAPKQGVDNVLPSANLQQEQPSAPTADMENAAPSTDIHAAQDGVVAAPIDPASASAPSVVSEAVALPQIEGGATSTLTKGNAVFPAIQAENQKALKSQDTPNNDNSLAAASLNVPSTTTEAVLAKKVPVAVGAAASLKFAFSDSSWVTVRDSTNKVLLSQNNEGGSSVQVKGVPPFKVIVGNAKMVSLTYQGRPVDLINNVKSGEVARLTLQ